LPLALLLGPLHDGEIPTISPIHAETGLALITTVLNEVKKLGMGGIGVAGAGSGHHQPSMILVL
jgi:hypothetical protein